MAVQDHAVEELFPEAEEDDFDSGMCLLLGALTLRKLWLTLGIGHADSIKLEIVGGPKKPKAQSHKSERGQFLEDLVELKKDSASAKLHDLIRKGLTRQVTHWRLVLGFLCCVLTRFSGNILDCRELGRGLC